MKNTILSGVFVNGLGVVAGGLAGLLLKQGISEKVKTLLMQGLALGVLYVGLSGVGGGHNTVYIIISLTIGAIIGETINFDRYFHAFGEWIQRKIPVSGETSLAEGFVSCTLFICPGAMAIVGSLECGLGGGCDVLYVKALIDLILALRMATTLGMGVALAAVSVLAYESFLTLSASFISRFLTDIVVDEITCVGSVLVVALGLNLLKVTNIKISNLILAPFIPILLYAVLG